MKKEKNYVCLVRDSSQVPFKYETIARSIAMEYNLLVDEVK
jgi:hypothetical protein